MQFIQKGVARVHRIAVMILMASDHSPNLLIAPVKIYFSSFIHCPFYPAQFHPTGTFHPPSPSISPYSPTNKIVNLKASHRLASFVSSEPMNAFFGVLIDISLQMFAN